MGAQPNDFRYFLTLDNERTEIVFAPDGWDKDTIVSYKRSGDYFGVIRSFSLPLRFVLDGADLLRLAFYKYGIEAEVRIEIEELEPSTWQYKNLFYGDIDFSTFEDTMDHIRVTLMEGGATRDIKAFENVKYEYELTGPDVVDVVLPGIGFSETTTYVFGPAMNGRGTRRLPQIIMAANGFPSGYISGQGVEAKDFSDDGFGNSDGWFVKGNKPVPIQITVKGRIKGYAVKIKLNNGILQRFTIEVRNNSGIIIQTIYTSPLIGLKDYERIDYDVPFTINYPINNGEQLFFYIRPDPLKNGYNNLSVYVDEGEFQVYYSTVSDPSICKGLTAYSLYKRIINRISSGTALNSFMLLNNWTNLIFTCGDGIREISPAKIKITFKDFFKTFKGLEDAAFGLENGVARLESGSYFARNIQILDLGEVKELSIVPAEDYIFNSVKIGYDDGNTDNTDGQQEYNSGQQWVMPITRIQKQEDWISPSRADQYGIEKIRIDYNVKNDKAEKRTNDTSSDNDTFMIDCHKDGEVYRPILGDTYAPVEGLKAWKTAYNLNLTPKKNLLRHAPYLRSMLDKLDTRYINFGSGDKNTDLMTMKDGIRVKENENIIISSIPGKYFMPYLANVTSNISRNTAWLIDNTPFGYVTFTWKGVKINGYIVEVSVDIAKNSEREFKLLLTNENNLLSLI